MNGFQGGYRVLNEAHADIAKHVADHLDFMCHGSGAARITPPSDR